MGSATPGSTPLQQQKVIFRPPVTLNMISFPLTNSLSEIHTSCFQVKAIHDQMLFRHCSLTDWYLFVATAPSAPAVQAFHQTSSLKGKQTHCDAWSHQALSKAGNLLCYASTPFTLQPQSTFLCISRLYAGALGLQCIQVRALISHMCTGTHGSAFSPCSVHNASRSQQEAQHS